MTNKPFPIMYIATTYVCISLAVWCIRNATVFTNDSSLSLLSKVPSRRSASSLSGASTAFTEYHQKNGGMWVNQLTQPQTLTSALLSPPPEPERQGSQSTRNLLRSAAALTMLTSPPAIHTCPAVLPASAATRDNQRPKRTGVPPHFTTGGKPSLETVHRAPHWRISPRGSRRKRNQNDIVFVIIIKNKGSRVLTSLPIPGVLLSTLVM